ncbi:MAG: tetratricopeptide repeat protein [Gemmatimonadetes bacterium]|nr:tetratricopeptide repeat protein [Gemmatimonadota bacterium]
MTRTPRSAARSVATRRPLRAAAALAAASLAGCLATQNDLRVLQADVAVVRAEAARNDSARTVQLAAALAALKSASDSMRALSARMARWQGDSRDEFRLMQQQLIQIQELTGQSQRRLQELRAGLEDRGGAPVGAGAAGADSGRGAGSPGPNQLLQLALEQLRRGSAGSARAGFGDLLARFPESDAAQLAQFYVAESFAAEGNSTSADSVYRLVIARQPPSPKASTATYKHALVLLAAGKTAEAKAALASVVARFPQSDEAVLAADRLKLLR